VWEVTDVAPVVAIVDMCSSGHWTLIISVFDCDNAEAALSAAADVLPEEEEYDAVAAALGPFSESFPSTSTETETSVENDFVFSLLTEFSVELVKPVSIATEVPCVLLVTRRQKPRMVLSVAATAGTSALTSGEST